VSQAGADELPVQYQNFPDKNFKHCLIT